MCVQHHPEHDSDGTAVAVHVMTAYRAVEVSPSYSYQRHYMG